LWSRAVVIQEVELEVGEVEKGTGEGQAVVEV
jgi:hypothetical protein